MNLDANYADAQLEDVSALPADLIDALRARLDRVNDNFNSECLSLTHAHIYSPFQTGPMALGLKRLWRHDNYTYVYSRSTTHTNASQPKTPPLSFISINKRINLFVTGAGVFDRKEVMRAFLAFFIAIFGTYRRFFTVVFGELKFQKESFLQAQTAYRTVPRDF